MRTILYFLLSLSLLNACTLSTRAEVPVPSPFPVSWELKFEPAAPKRISVQLPGQETPSAFWYLTYTVTNNTEREQNFFPVFEMLTHGGQVIRSDKDIPAKVFAAIKEHEKKQFLEPAELMSGKLRIGIAEAKDSVAIWPEPDPRMGNFSIFVQGLSGEFVRTKDAAGNDATLRKCLRLNYLIRGDEVYPGQDEVNVKPSEWIMR